MKKTAFKRFLSALKNSFVAFNRDKGMKLGAALACYVLLALPLLLVVIAGLGSLFYSQHALQVNLFFQGQELAGNELAAEVHGLLEKNAWSKSSYTATVISTVVLLLGVGGLFGEMQDSVNAMWGLKVKKGKDFALLLFKRFLSFSMIFVLACIFLSTLFLDTALGVFFHRVEKYFSATLLPVFYYVNYMLMAGIMLALFAFIFKVLPDARIKWKDAWSGSLFTTLLFLAGKFLAGYYLARVSVADVYGVAGSLVGALLWVYYSSLIFYFGVEFTQVRARFSGKDIEPRKYAIRIEKNLVIKKYKTEMNQNLEKIRKKKGFEKADATVNFNLN